MDKVHTTKRNQSFCLQKKIGHPTLLLQQDHNVKALLQYLHNPLCHIFAQKLVFSSKLDTIVQFPHQIMWMST